MKRIASHAIGMIGVLTLTFVGSIDATAGTLDQIKQTNRLRIGYRSDARPLSGTRTNPETRPGTRSRSVSRSPTPSRPTLGCRR